MNSMKVLIWCRHIGAREPPGEHWSATARTGWLLASEFVVIDLAEDDRRLTWLRLISDDIVDYNLGRTNPNCYEIYNYLFTVDYTLYAKTIQGWAQDSESS